MSKSLELPDATYDAVLVRAANEGLTPADWVARQTDSASEPPSKPTRTLYDKLKPFIGCVEGQGEDLAGNHSQIFADQLEQQHLTGER